MRYRYLAEQIYLRPWLITAEAHASIRLLFSQVIERGFTPTAMDLADMFPQRKPLEIDGQGIATVHIFGPVGKGLSAMEQSCGATSMEQIRSDYASALAGGARGILLHVDSPGGTITGTPEIADLVASQPLPTVAYTEDMMASAAYYMAAGANLIVASKSADVGSIGVYIPWVDSSAQYEAEGLKPDPIIGAGGDLKAIGFGGSLTPEHRAYLQEGVDSSLADFKAHILAHRNVPESAMRGQTLDGKAALAANLVDAIGDMGAARAILSRLISATV